MEKIHSFVESFAENHFKVQKQLAEDANVFVMELSKSGPDKDVDTYLNLLKSLHSDVTHLAEGHLTSWLEKCGLSFQAMLDTWRASIVLSKRKFVVIQRQKARSPSPDSDQHFQLMWKTQLSFGPSLSEFETVVNITDYVFGLYTSKRTQRQCFEGLQETQILVSCDYIKIFFL